MARSWILWKAELWAKSYKGTNFSPAHIVEMDEEMDDAIKALSSHRQRTAMPTQLFFCPSSMSHDEHIPAIKSALTEAR